MTIVIDHAELGRIARRVFAAAGSSDTEAGIVADHLVEANLRGHDSHGVGMIPSYLRNLANGTLVANRAGRVANESGSLIVYDGERGYGQIVARRRDRDRHNPGARLRGRGDRSAQRASYRPGRDLRRDVRRGRTGFDAFRQHHRPEAERRPVARRRRALWHQPGMYRDPRRRAWATIVLDMATSVIAMGKVRVARNKGERLTPGILLDAQGQPTTDPNVHVRQPRGALRTFGEHKGYALAFICEILAGAIAGGGTMRPERIDGGTTTNGMLTVVIDPSHLVDRAWLVAEIKAMTDYVTGSPPVTPDAPVLIPGDPERQSRAERIVEGVPIDDETWREIIEAARGVNVLVEAPRVH